MDESVVSNMRRIAIVGTVGVPANYGGFETLAENLTRYIAANHGDDRLLVVCSARSYPEKTARFLTADLQYVPLSANGPSSVLYDAIAMIKGLAFGANTILVLGVSGALFLPLVRALSRSRIVINVDGIEWRREKWSLPARKFLQFSEWLAVRLSHVVVADNQGVADYIWQRHGRVAVMIPYGGDHAVKACAESQEPVLPASFPARYALALSRIEPENKVHTILSAFGSGCGLPLVYVGNWQSSSYGRELRARFGASSHLLLLDAIYDKSSLRAVRQGACLYVHGHSAGGTNPALVEMMHFGVPVAAYDCVFNRHTTEGQAAFFRDESTLVAAVKVLSAEVPAERNGVAMKEIAQARYTWDIVGSAYYRLFASPEAQIPLATSEMEPR